MNKVNCVGSCDAGSNTLGKTSEFVADRLFPDIASRTSEKGVDGLSFASDVVVNVIDQRSGKKVLHEDSVKIMLTRRVWRWRCNG